MKIKGDAYNFIRDHVKAAWYFINAPGENCAGYADFKDMVEDYKEEGLGLGSAHRAVWDLFWTGRELLQREMVDSNYFAMWEELIPTEISDGHLEAAIKQAIKEVC